MFEIYIDGALLSYITKGSQNENGIYYLIIDNGSPIDNPSYYVQLKGYYVDQFGEKKNFIREPVRIINLPKASDELVCSDLLCVSDIIYGYMYAGNFYLDKTTNNGVVTYIDIVDPTSYNGKYYDNETNALYKRNSNSAQFDVI